MLHTLNLYVIWSYLCEFEECLYCNEKNNTEPDLLSSKNSPALKSLTRMLPFQGSRVKIQKKTLQENWSSESKIWRAIKMFRQTEMVVTQHCECAKCH